jgi:CRP-like cAMP-binding protein
MELFRRHPWVGAALYWELSQEEALVAEHLVNIGRRDAYTRLGHLFAELFWRLDAVGLVQDYAYDFPLNQTLLADALALTPVHVSRTLQRLRQDGLIELNGQQIAILDLQRLEKAVHFEAAYLHLIGMPIWLRRRLNHKG